MPNFDLKKIHENLYELPKQEDMLVPGRIYGNKVIIDDLLKDIAENKSWNALQQIYNVATLPGIQKYSLAMSDVHPGYGFPIGGVGAFDIDTGVIAVGGVGFDINCGVRALTTPLKKDDLNEEIKNKIANQFFRDIPVGLGSKGAIKLSLEEIDEVLVKGAEFAIERGFGLKEDLEFIEENGRVENANPANVSEKAKKRQFRQVGTLGSGNHYLEMQYVDEIFDQKAAEIFGLKKDQVIISLHCGSRALGHQIGTDYLKILYQAALKYKLPIREKELVCAPFKSPEGQQYFTAVNCGINTAFANRQVLTHLVRNSLFYSINIEPEKIKVLYDVGHNNVKIEEHEGRQLLVHRKGATRAFGPGRKEIPAKYQSIGQPVIVGGTMGTHSYILRGTEQGMKETWGSACHGAGRLFSRIKAKKKWRADELIKELGEKGIVIKGKSKSGLAEEAPGSYKDVDIVVNVMHNASISKKVAKLKPMIVIKG